MIFVCSVYFSALNETNIKMENHLVFMVLGLMFLGCVCLATPVVFEGPFRRIRIKLILTIESGTSLFLIGGSGSG